MKGNILDSWEAFKVPAMEKNVIRSRAALMEILICSVILCNGEVENYSRQKAIKSLI